MKTTLEMDGYFTERDIAHRYDAYVQCRSCRKWTLIEGTSETYGHLLKGAKCGQCENSNIDFKSIISWRTYNPFVHAKRKPE